MAEGDDNAQPISPLDALNPRQRIFVIEYLRDFNATRAAKAAGYSEHTARAIGCENLTKPNIAAAIKDELYRRGITRERIEIEAAKIAFGPGVAAFDEWVQGNKTLGQLEGEGVDLAQLLAIAESDKGGRRVRGHDRLRAIELLGKLRALLTERHEIDTTGRRIVICGEASADGVAGGELGSVPGSGEPGDPVRRPVGDGENPDATGEGAGASG